MKKGRNQKGFTLVELMVVVVIIGILAAIAVPVYNKVSGTAETNACIANQRTIEGAWQVYQVEDKAGDWPEDYITGATGSETEVTLPDEPTDNCKYTINNGKVTCEAHPRGEAEE